MIILIGYVENM